MSAHQLIPDETDKYYSRFEQSLALAWAQAHLTDFMRNNPDRPAEEKKAVFLQALEGGFGLALELRKGNV